MIKKKWVQNISRIKLCIKCVSEDEQVIFFTKIIMCNYMKIFLIKKEAKFPRNKYFE